MHSNFDPTTSINLQLTVYCLLGQRRFHTQLKVQSLLSNYWKSFEVESNLIKYSVIVNSLLSLSMYLEIHSLHNRRYFFSVFLASIVKGEVSEERHTQMGEGMGAITPSLLAHF